MQRWISRTSSLFSVRTHRRNWTQKAGGLVEAELPANPMRLLDEWLAAALEQGHIIERGFVLATSTPEEGPTARTVVCGVPTSDAMWCFLPLDRSRYFWRIM